MNDIEGKIRCLELAEKNLLKLSERDPQKIVANADIFWQYVSNCENSATSAPSAEGEKDTTKSSKRNRKKQGQAGKDDDILS